jgi:hypothetical protein
VKSGNCWAKTLLTKPSNNSPKEMEGIFLFIMIAS